MITSIAEAHQWEINNEYRTGFTAGHRGNQNIINGNMNELTDANYNQIKWYGKYNAVD